MIPDELVFSWRKERSEAKENICTGQQHPKKAETPSALSSVKSQADRVHLECSDSLTDACLANSPGATRPAWPEDVSPFSTCSYHTLITSIQSRCLSK